VVDKPINTIYLSIAGFNIKLDFYPKRISLAPNPSYNKLFESINSQFKGFVSEPKSKVDYTVIFQRQHPTILKKRIKGHEVTLLHFYTQKPGYEKIFTYQHISVSQFLVLLKRIVHKLLIKNHGFILHASAVKFNDKAIIFVGRHGAGKSTAMTLLNKSFPAIADDSVIVKKEGNSYSMYQTPFVVEKNRWILRGKSRYEIAKICFLKKSPYFKLEKINDKEFIVLRLVKQIFSERIGMARQAKYLIEFVEKFDCFNFLFFAKDIEKLTRLLRKSNNN